MRIILALFILGCVALRDQIPIRAASVTADWPSLNAGAAQSNFNPTEKAFTAKNVLRLKVRWSAPMSSYSYPVVAANRIYVPFDAGSKIHVRALDVATGKQLALYPKDALGGLLAANTYLYLAGHVLQAVDPATGQRIGQLPAPAGTVGGDFVFPQADSKVIVSGWYSPNGISNIYTAPADLSQLWQKLASVSALSTLTAGRILTQTSGGSSFYDESSGRAIAHPPYLGSNWFAGDTLAYTVASLKKKSAMVYAFDGTGQKVWSHRVGPPLATQNSDWPHAVTPTAVYVAALQRQQTIQALDPFSGHVLWSRVVPSVQSIAVAGNLLYALTYGLGEPVKLIILHADTGKPAGAIVLSAGYYAFGARNGLMVADDMVFLRVIGPHGPQVVALGL